MRRPLCLTARARMGPSRSGPVHTSAPLWASQQRTRPSSQPVYRRRASGLKTAAWTVRGWPSQQRTACMLGYQPARLAQAASRRSVSSGGASARLRPIHSTPCVRLPCSHRVMPRSRASWAERRFSARLAASASSRRRSASLRAVSASRRRVSASWRALSFAWAVRRSSSLACSASCQPCRARSACSSTRTSCQSTPARPSNVTSTSSAARPATAGRRRAHFQPRSSHPAGRAAIGSPAR